MPRTPHYAANRGYDINGSAAPKAGTVSPSPTSADHVRADRDMADITNRATRRSTLIGINVGMALETFDFTAYAIFAPFFARSIFNPADPTAALLATMAVFGAAFLVRPFGAVAFGWLADRKGRKFALISAVICASCGLLLVGLAPSYQTAGLTGACVLLFARLLQGVAHTGEVAAAYTYIAETAPSRSRGLWASSLYASSLIAVVIANIVGLILSSVMNQSQLTSWGWRIPFFIGACLGLLSLVLRRNMVETEAFMRQAARGVMPQKKNPMWRELWNNKAAGARVFLLAGSNAVFFYAWAISGPSWGISILKLSPTHALWSAIIAQLVCVIALPFLGALSDRIGRRASYCIYGVAVAALSFPLHHLAQGGGTWQFALAMSIALFIFAFNGSMFPALLAELFPAGIRASGVALPYSLSAMVFAGTAPFLQQWLGQQGLGNVFVMYTAAMALLGAVVMIFTKETSRVDLTD